jgi:glycerol uptake operon antiterminator
VASSRDPWTAVRASPVIAAVRSDAAAGVAAASPVAAAFVLTGTILSLPGLVARLADAGKMVLVHVDLTEGLAADRAAVQFVRTLPGAAGILTTRGHLIQAAHSVGLLAVLRLFLLDSASLDTATKLLRSCTPDAVEVLPGLLYPALAPEIGAWSVPVIAGGFIRRREDVRAVLRAGALAVSTSTSGLWAHDLAGESARR